MKVLELFLRSPDFGRDAAIWREPPARGGRASR
jgi:hypothetical protein